MYGSRPNIARPLHAHHSTQNRLAYPNGPELVAVLYTEARTLEAIVVSPCRWIHSSSLDLGGGQDLREPAEAVGGQPAVGIILVVVREAQAAF